MKGAAQCTSQAYWYTLDTPNRWSVGPAHGIAHTLTMTTNTRHTTPQWSDHLLREIGTLRREFADLQEHLGAADGG